MTSLEGSFDESGKLEDPKCDPGGRFVLGMEWQFNKLGKTRMCMTDEIWFPPVPQHVPMVVARFENKNGNMVFVPQESRTFFK
jgi:hypothetical protein